MKNNKKNYSDTITFLKSLHISDEEALRALLSFFASVQPGPVRQSWLRSVEYGQAPTTKEIWDILVRSKFRCQICGTRGDLTIDHINRNTKDVALENFRVLCRKHNRSINSRPVVNPDTNLRIYRAIKKIKTENKQFPSPAQIRAETGIQRLGAAIYMIRFFQHLDGISVPVRPYNVTKCKYHEKHG